MVDNEASSCWYISPSLFRCDMLEALIVGENILYIIDPVRWLASQTIVASSIQVMRFSSSSTCQGRMVCGRFGVSIGGGGGELVMAHRAGLVIAMSGLEAESGYSGD